LALVGDDLQRAGLSQQIPAGFILAGGGAYLNGLLELTEQTFHLPVRMGQPRGIADLPEAVVQPDYATVIGLVLSAAKSRRTAPPKASGFVSKLRAMFAGA
jgi:cell division protein FtsA